MPDTIAKPKYCVEGHAVKDLVQVRSHVPGNISGTPLRNPLNPAEWDYLGATMSFSVCTGGLCGSSDVNAWYGAAKHWMENDYPTIINKFKKAIDAKQGGVANDTQKAALANAEEIFNEWSKFSSEWKPYTKGGDLGAVALPGRHFRVKNKIVQIATYWNDAACAAEQLERNLPEGVNRQQPGEPGGPPAVPSSEDEPNKTFWQRLTGNEPPAGGGNKKSARGKFVAGAAIVGGGFLIYKVLTE